MHLNWVFTIYYSEDVTVPAISIQISVKLMIT